MTGRERSTEVYSMSRWTSAGESLSPRLQRFSQAIRLEEAGKEHRLRRLAQHIGLPVYEVRSFRFPDDAGALETCCREMCAEFGWRLAVRVVENGQLLLRELDITPERTIKECNRLYGNQSLVVTVTPYRVPELSGTFWVRDGQVLLEVAMGPHFWLSKWAPPEEEVLRCWVSPTATSVAYSTVDLERRRLLFHTATAVSRHTLGCSLRLAATMALAVYAEFHWHATLGYRFIECSFSPTWTAGTSRPK